jgi:hypothetical protein
MPFEPVGSAAVGDDVEEAQELTVEAPAGGDDAGQKGVVDSSRSGPVAVHLGARERERETFIAELGEGRKRQ